MPQVVSNFLGSRKDLVMALIIGAATAMFWLGKLDASAWENLLKWVGGGWLGARGIEDAAKHLAAAKSAQPS